MLFFGIKNAVFQRVAMLCRIDVPRLELRSMVIICKKIDPSSIYQDLFNSQSFPINRWTAQQVLGYPSRELRQKPTNHSILMRNWTKESLKFLQVLRCGIRHRLNF